MSWKSILKIQIRDIEPKDNPLSDEFEPPKIPELKENEVVKTLEDIIKLNVENIISDGFVKQIVKIDFDFTEDYIGLEQNIGKGLEIYISPVIVTITSKQMKIFMDEYVQSKRNRRTNITLLERLTEEITKSLLMTNEYLFEVEMDRRNKKDRSKIIKLVEKMLYDLMESLESDESNQGNFGMINFERFKFSDSTEIKLLEDIVSEEADNFEERFDSEERVRSLVQEILYEAWWSQLNEDEQISSDLNMGMQTIDEYVATPEEYIESKVEEELGRRRKSG